MNRDLSEAMAFIEQAECAELRDRLIRAERHIAHLEDQSRRACSKYRRMLGRRERLIRQQAEVILRFKYGEPEHWPAANQRLAQAVTDRR